MRSGLSKKDLRHLMSNYKWLIDAAMKNKSSDFKDAMLFAKYLDSCK